MDITLYWLTQDLRLDDNPALVKAAQSDRLIMAYCVDQRWFRPHRYHIASMGAHRWRFLNESLHAFGQQLAALNQHLHVEYGFPEQSLSALITKHNISRLICARQVGSDERRTLRWLQNKHRHLQIIEVDTCSLFDQQHTDTRLETLRKGFTPFRQHMTDQAVPQPLQAPTSLPRPPLRVVTDAARPDWLPAPSQSQMVESHDIWRGGEPAGVAHLGRYFSGDLPARYKELRNHLGEPAQSTALSPWLAHGNLSARRIMTHLARYESQICKNESTQWIAFELLWREYFRWLALAQGDALYRLKGLAATAPRTCLHPERHQRWCHGNTPWPLVNACMNELRETGMLSNRGRQIAASCYVNELGLDWRYGAAWFEHNLLDYDVSSNWGNWQYIAGVGVDPRGGRHFNLDKQMQSHDAAGAYRKRWAPDEPSPHIDSVDAADWPLM